MPGTVDLPKLRAELEKEFRQVRENLEQIRMAMAAVEQAGPEDDLYGLLDHLDEAVTKVRTGGVFGAGAKGHRKALEAYREAAGSA